MPWPYLPSSRPLHTIDAADASGAGVALWILNCSGPQPQVLDVQLIGPLGPGQPYRVEATVSNRGRGHGEVAVTFRLRDRTTRQTVEEERRAQLQPGETVRVAALILAPPGSYEPEVQVEYPPR